MVTEKSTALPSAKILQPSISKDASASFDVSNDRAESGEGSEKGSGAGTGMEEGTGDGAGEAGGSGSGGPSFDTDAIQPDVSPTLLSGSAPNYPEAMRSRGIEGRVTVQMVVGKDGAVEAASVIQSSGYGVMDKAALSAAYTYAFAPAYKEGYAVRCYARRPLSLPYTKENPMKRKWMMVLGFLPLLMGIPPSHHLDAAPGLYLSKAGMALPAGTVAQEAAQSGIIFFGEEHTNALSHKREFELLTELTALFRIAWSYRWKCLKRTCRRLLMPTLPVV